MACSFASLSCPAHKPCIWVARGAGLATGKLHSTLRRSPALQARWLGAHGAAIARISSEGAVRVRDSKVQKNQRRKLKIEIGWPDALAIGAHPTQSIGFGPPNRIRLLLSMTRVGDAYHVPLKPVLEHIPNRKSALRRRRPTPDRVVWKRTSQCFAASRYVRQWKQRWCVPERGVRPACYGTAVMPGGQQANGQARGRCSGC